MLILIEQSISQTKNKMKWGDDIPSNNKLENININNGEDISYSDLDIENENTKEDLDKKIKFPSTQYQMFFNDEISDDKISDDKVSDDKINNEMDNKINNEMNKWLEEYKKK